MNVVELISIVLLLILVTCGDGEYSEVRITMPQDGSTVGGMVRVETNVMTAVMVQFYVDDTLMYTRDSAPFVFTWNTFLLSNNSSHGIYAKVKCMNYDEVYSDTILVTIDNGTMIFADDFESYVLGDYPYAGWFEIWPGAGSSYAYVDRDIASTGEQRFRLEGTEDLVRTDGVELVLDEVDHLIYETSLMVPSNDSAGALFGFFVLLNPSLGAIYNGVWFNRDDNLVYARGVVEDSTGRTWEHDTWYSVMVTLDYSQMIMNVWLGDEQIVSDLPAMPRDLTDTFALATEHGTHGIVYYDDVRMLNEAGSTGAAGNRSRPAP
jgi:hypothetical protein